jgi:hypothetical protein
MIITLTCGWADCAACMTLRSFVERHGNGEITGQPGVTSAWWDAPEADLFYQRGVNLPPCRHPEGGEQW